MYWLVWYSKYTVLLHGVTHCQDMIKKDIRKWSSLDVALKLFNLLFERQCFCLEMSCCYFVLGCKYTLLCSSYYKDRKIVALPPFKAVDLCILQVDSQAVIVFVKIIL